MTKHKEPVLETERLIIRPIELKDAQEIYQWTGDERVTRYMSYPTHTDISQTIEWIKSTFSDDKEYNWAFVLKENNKVIGTGGIGPNAQMKEYWGIGYNLHYDYWHKGYCTEAMRAIIAFAHNELGVSKICSCHAVDNPRSGKVMEKCGLKFHHYGEYSKIDNSITFKAKYYALDFHEQ